ncbi:unnamed protein product [Symbiodinium microadriaticum]|nr:unnamed protein product [Symbiodinium microadriaticum]
MSVCMIIGKYSQQEQLRLVAAIRKACECAEDTPKENLPSQGISWVTVARLMNNERLPLDYQRKWVTLRTVDIGDAETATREDAGLELSDRASSGDHSDRQILSFLADLEPEDESEVTWSIIDRELTLRRGYARMRWLQMCNQAMFGPQHDMEFRLKRLLDMKGVSGQDFNAIHRMKTVARPSENPVHDGNQSADSTIPLPVLATSPESDTVGLCQVEVAEYTMREDEHQNDDGSDILSTSMISPIENQLGAEEMSKKKHRKKHSRDHNVESGGGIQHEEKKHKKKRKYLEETDEKEDNSSKKNKKRKHKNRSE